MQANHIAWALRDFGNPVDVQRGGVRRQDGAWLHDAVELGEDL